MALPVDISAWKPAPFDLKGETVFAIGDVHGCATELAVLLEAIRGLARDTKGKRRLVYLGDMIRCAGRVVGSRVEDDVTEYALDLTGYANDRKILSGSATIRVAG